MIFDPCKLNDVYTLYPKVHEDSRGWFSESFKLNDIPSINFIQVNQSFSKERYTLRGLHFQTGEFAQTKLVQVVQGRIMDVVVDLRQGSRTFGQWDYFFLDDQSPRQLLVPKGFAHGFITLTTNTRIMYNVDAPYSPEYDSGIIWNDPDLRIKWPTDNPILSDKDSKLKTFKELFK
jgi:dTDP-4-dehydrorhamnose 3,5-epimerase